MADRLLHTMGITETPESIEVAIMLFRATRQRLENQFDSWLGKELEFEVLQLFQRVGYSV
jgi:hypothetical protein